MIIDGCNPEYINEEATPFLYALKEKGGYMEISFTPTFANRVEIFTGKSPRTTDTFVDFCYDPKRSPFKFLKFLRKKVTLKNRSPTVRKLLSLCSFLSSGFFVDPINIPLSFLPYFSLNESMIKFLNDERKRTEEHLFGVLEREGFEVDFLYGTTVGVMKRVMGMLHGERKVLFVHFGETDGIGHKCGPNSPEMRKTLRLISAAIKKIFESGKFDFIFVFGDHNMVQVHENLNLWQGLRKLEIKPLQDYIFFLNSPMARFWFRNERAEEIVKEHLSSLKCGKVVTKKELKKREIPVHEKYGELIFWMKKGINISPDFYHTQKVKGMHGYLDEDARVPFIAFRKDGELRMRKRGRLRDIAPTLLDLLGVRSERMEGRSLLKRK